MAINFPVNPTDGQQFTVGSKVYIYNATKGFWAPQPADDSNFLKTENGVVTVDAELHLSDGTDTRELSVEGDSLAVDDKKLPVLETDGSLILPPTGSFKVETDSGGTREVAVLTESGDLEVSGSITVTGAVSATNVTSTSSESSGGEGGGATGDPNWDNVQLLIQSDTTDGSTTFTDSSASPHNITATGDVHHETDQKKFGASSIHFDGSGDKLEVTTSVPSALGTGDWTIEMWFYRDSVSGGSGYSYLMDYRNDDGSGNHVMPALYLNNSGVIELFVNGSAIVQSSAVSLDTWYHLAVVKSSGTTKMYLNGTQTGSDYSDSNNYVATDLITIGEYGPYDGYALDGYIEDIRITKGHARYTENFSVPTEAFPAEAYAEETSATTEGGTTATYQPAGTNQWNQSGTSTAVDPIGDEHWANTKLILPFTSTDSFNGFAGHSGSGWQMTADQGSGGYLIHSAHEADGVTTDQTAPWASKTFYTGATGGLHIVTNEISPANTGFTIEGFFYFPTNSGEAWQNIVNVNTSGGAGSWNTSTKFQLGLNASFGLVLWNGVTAYTNGSLSTETWYHIVIDQYGSDSGNMKVFVNGTEVNSISRPAALGESGSVLALGVNTAGGEQLVQHISDFRVTAGVSRYEHNVPDLSARTTMWTTGAYVSGESTFTPDGNIFYDDGNVGIGTSAPTSTLHVVGDLNVTGELSRNGIPIPDGDNLTQSAPFEFTDTTTAIKNVQTGWNTTEASGGEADPYWNDTVLLLDGEATDKSPANISFSGQVLTTGFGGKWSDEGCLLYTSPSPRDS